jgi:flagellar biosynthetic protein FliR
LILRVVLAIALGSVFWWVGGQVQVDAPDHLFALGVMALREGVVGMALGLALSTLTSMLVSAGEIVSSEMGFSLARTMNPDSGVDATVVSQLMQVLGFLLILQLNLHHEALRVLEQTYSACPVGQPFDIAPIWHGLQVMVSNSIELAVQYAFPILGLMLLASVGLVLLGRAVPAINLMEFGFGLKVMLALGVMAVFLVEGAPFLVHTFTALIDSSRAMFPG